MVEAPTVYDLGVHKHRWTIDMPLKVVGFKFTKAAQGIDKICNTDMSTANFFLCKSEKPDYPDRVEVYLSPDAGIRPYHIGCLAKETKLTGPVKGAISRFGIVQLQHVGAFITHPIQDYVNFEILP